MRKPRIYQLGPIKRLRSLKSALVFVPVRGGKTKIVIDALRRNNRMPRTLIVCPLTVIGVWQSELVAEGITNQVAIICGTRKQKRALMKTEGSVVFLTNYETISAMRTDASLYLSDCAVVALDESTKIKHSYTAIAKAACGSLRGIPRRFALTGTPTPESLLDLWQPVDFVAPNLFDSSFFRWRETYFTPNYWGTKWAPNPGTKEKLFEKIASITVSVDEADIGYAPENDIPVSLELSPETRQVYDHIQHSFSAVLDGCNWESHYVVAVMEKLSQICSGFLSFGSHTRLKTRRTRPIEVNIDAVLLRAAPPHLREKTQRFWDCEKIDWLYAFLRDHRGEKVVIWFRHTLVGELLATMLKKANWPFAVLTGETPASERRKQLRVFALSSFAAQAMQIDTAKHGIEALAHHVIFFEPTWSFEAYYQARKRAQLAGGTKTINFYLLQTNYTIEELFYEVLAKKENLHTRFKEVLLEKGAKP